MTGRRLTVLNRHQLSARRGLIVTGGAGTGKTTAITQLGKAHELALRRRNADGGPVLPVVYLSVPPAATPKMLAVEFARFLGLPLQARANITDVTDAVCGVLIDLGCDLVLVDELHNLNLATRAGAEVSDQLKYFSERLPATFVYARHRPRPHRPVRRSPRPADRQQVHDPDLGAVRLRHHHPARAVARPRRDPRANPPAATPPPPQRRGSRRPSPPPHRRDDRQPVPPDPWGGDRRHHHRHEQITRANLDAVLLDHAAEEHRTTAAPAPNPARKRRAGAA